jgi:hypothetical protein
MCLKDVMHDCKLKENTSIAFFQYRKKTAANALLPAITKKWFE